MSCGLGQLIPYFECQYPEVIADNSVVVNSGGSGMGDYIDPFTFPIPQYLTPGNNRGLGCACGGACCGGMGSLFDGTGFLGSGLFTSADPSTWGAGEFGALAIGALAFYYVVRGVNKVERRARGVKRSVKGKVRAVKSGVRRRAGGARTFLTGS